ncbi:MAG: putative glycosyltransferase, partial [Bryobacterales bacterium]|nr:putative glycosyltransferase [Bryobacterales bacterium]
MGAKISNLLIVSHVLHYEYRGRVYAYGPYTREIDIWADLVPEIRIASPLCAEEPPKDCLPFTRANIRLVPQRRTGGDTFAAKAAQILKLPMLVTDLCRAMRRSDAIHVRCPGNLGLLGAILAPLFSPRIIAKYAGQWNGYHSEPLSVRLQRRILTSQWWRRGLVTVYGEWPGQPGQVVPFFTSMMTSSQVRDSAEVALRKSLSTPARILFSGRLASLKAVDVLLRALAILARQNIPFELSVVGDGPERPNLERLVRELRIDAQVAFMGAIPFDEAMLCYKRAHFLVLPSRHSEGWPKVLA